MSWLTNIFKRNEPKVICHDDGEMEALVNKVDALDRLIVIAKLRQHLIDRFERREIDTFIYEKFDNELKKEATELRAKNKID